MNYFSDSDIFLDSENCNLLLIILFANENIAYNILSSIQLAKTEIYSYILKNNNMLAYMAPVCQKTSESPADSSSQC